MGRGEVIDSMQAGESDDFDQGINQEMLEVVSQGNGEP